MNAELPASPAWTIREANEDDLETIVELRMAMADDLAPTMVPGLTSEELAERRAIALEGNRTYAREHLCRDLTSWLAEVDGQPVGSAAILWFRHPPSTMRPHGIEAYVLNVYTRPEFRRLGIARALMQTVLDAAKARNVERVWLRASEYGRPLYESMGFRQKNYLELVESVPDSDEASGAE